VCVCVLGKHQFSKEEDEEEEGGRKISFGHVYGHAELKLVKLLS